MACIELYEGVPTAQRQEFYWISVDGKPLSLGQKPNIWQDYCRKLYENERNWTEGSGGRRVPGAPLDPTMDIPTILSDSVR